MAQLHWRTYSLMVAALISGVLLAAGHHFFYNNLAGKPVATGGFQLGYVEVSKQQANIALGTTFAFLVRAFLALAVSTAYAQVVWAAVKGRETRLSAIDSMFSILRDVSSFFSGSVWRHPLLILLALTVWLIPIASLITPATLIVGVAPVEPVPSAMIRVPNVDFLSLNFASLVAAASTDIGYTYTGPLYSVDKVVTATAGLGQILPLAAPAANSSWTLDFHGPSLTCVDLKGETADQIIKNVKDSLPVKQPGYPYPLPYGYIGWTPDIDNFGDNLPFDGKSTLRSESLGYGSFGSGSNYVANTATIYLAAFMGTSPTGNFNLDPSTSLSNYTIVQCGLFNTSYHASFSFIDGAQTINITRGDNYNGVQYVGGLSSNTGNSPLADLDPLGNAIPGSFNTTELEIFSYQSVMHSLGKIVVGAIRGTFNLSGIIEPFNTTVMSTILSDTAELHSITAMTDTGVPGNLAQLLSQSANSSGWKGSSILDTPSNRLPLRQAMEDLFQNITISLMSSTLLQPNASSIYAPPLTNVTLPASHQIYVYSKSKLLIAYGVAIGICTLCVLVGILSMISSGMAYSNKFSTILRTSRYAIMTTPVLGADLDGKDPLPNYLGKATISFGPGKVSHGQLDDSGFLMASPGKWPAESNSNLLSSREERDFEYDRRNYI